MGLPYVYPDNDLTYAGNFLHDDVQDDGDRTSPIRCWNALDVLLILHADHEQNCSTTRCAWSAARRRTSTRRSRPAWRRSGARCTAAPTRKCCGCCEIETTDATSRTSLEGVKNREEQADGLRPPRLQELRPAGADHQEERRRGARGHRSTTRCSTSRSSSRSGRARRRVLHLAQALPERRLLLRHHLPGARHPDRHVHRHVRARPRTPGWIAQWKEMLEDPSRRSAARVRSTPARPTATTSPIGERSGPEKIIGPPPGGRSRPRRGAASRPGPPPSRLTGAGDPFSRGAWGGRWPGSDAIRRLPLSSGEGRECFASSSPPTGRRRPEFRVAGSIVMQSATELVVVTGSIVELLPAHGARPVRPADGWASRPARGDQRRRPEACAVRVGQEERRPQRRLCGRPPCGCRAVASRRSAHLRQRCRAAPRATTTRTPRRVEIVFARPIVKERVRRCAGGDAPWAYSAPRARVGRRPCTRCRAPACLDAESWPFPGRLDSSRGRARQLGDALAVRRGVPSMRAPTRARLRKKWTSCSQVKPIPPKVWIAVVGDRWRRRARAPSPSRRRGAATRARRRRPRRRSRSASEPPRPPRACRRAGARPPW